MIGTERWEILPACLRAVGRGLVLAAVMACWAAGSGGCVREYPDDHWLAGVDCNAGSRICLAERPDRRASTLVLARDCQEMPGSPPEAGIVAQRMTLTGDGKEIVFAGIGAACRDPTNSVAGIAIARFDDDGRGAGPAIEWPSDSWVVPVAPVVNGAHVVGPDGRFWSFVGDVAGTRGLMAYDRQSGGVQYAGASPAAPVSADVNWDPPNALAIALPGGVAIARGLASNDSQPAQLIPTVLEWWTFGPDGTPVWAAQTEIASGRPAHTLQSMRGQLRLFSVGDRLALLGDHGVAVALSAGSSTPELLGHRSASPGKPNFGSTSVLLPFRAGSKYPPGSVLYIGGRADDVDPETRRRLDLFDPASGTWTRAAELPRGRDSATAVLLPDGRILLAGDSQGSRDILYIDPLRGFAVTVSHDSLSRMRGLGLGGLVLADGRVVLAGGNEPDGDEPRAPPDVDVWEPPYLDAGARAARPTIATVSGPIPLGGRFSIVTTAESAPVTEVVLLAHSSSFMGNNPNQRLVQLEIERDGNDTRSSTIVLHGPPAGWAPAGRYLLFALGDDRIPSEGKAVDVVEGAAGP